MTATILSENVIDLIAQITNIHSQREKVVGNIQLFEHKLNIAHNALVSLSDEEQTIINKLHDYGFQYNQLIKDPNVKVVPSQPSLKTMSGIYNFPTLSITDILTPVEHFTPVESPKPVRSTPGLSIRRKV